MLVQELLDDRLGFPGVQEINILKQCCSQFLQESATRPVYKLLPMTYDDFHRVKVRRKPLSDDNVSEVFDRAFGTQHIRQRAIFVSGSLPVITENVEPFYVFPVDGYKFLYSKEVGNSNNDYQQVLDSLFEQFEDNDKAIEIVTDVLKYTYVRDNLAEGIISKSEIILYGIPCYYAMRVSAALDYNKINIR
jgi:hypothetical protein